MRFWDASAIVPLLVAERSSETLRSLLADDPGMVVWWTTQTECVSALARLEREGAFNAQDIRTGLAQLEQLTGNWQEIEPSEEVRETAARLLRVHPLRAADALQLAAAFAAASRRPSSLAVVVLDERLATAAQKEGFAVVDVTA